ncbi:dolichol-phosphate mannosyltransferase [Reichenbachiella agariperforans]|uniref:Dolichol-phosphate mannosyltransferase n=1 Tax=Reichenbachiella agariperforans TaxID=156994 RepID=A0A1M6M672_REIAG|nr:polyprenol monophosphomannose synthase [Reichenbachiella agariperforans]SHJ78951.1 dolichol-phosphate mannosyltransferase [Reichenbachiella agariperforans]
MNDSLVIIPTFNEKENIQAIIQTVIDLDQGFDVLIVDDGSPDGTATLVKSMMEVHPQIHIIEREGKLGLGTAYITGFQFAIDHGFDYIFEMDADFSHNPADLIRLRTACREDGYDMAVGSRYISGVNVVNWPMDRVLMSYFASIYVQFITGIPVKDTTAGFKCYRREVLDTIGLDNIHFVGYAFQIEMKFQAWKYNFKITEVPIIFTDRTLGHSKMSRGIFKEAVIGVIQMKIKSLFKKYIR